MSEELKLTKLERISLINQYKIMEALYPDEATQLSVQREVLERGYEMLYAWGFDMISDGEGAMSVDESKEVWDTMDMFDAIERSKPKNFDTSPYLRTKFGGYDGNNESKFMAFARFTVERLERFEYLPMERAGSWNSHMPVRDTYNRMLEKWKNLPSIQRFSMSVEQLKSVLDAASFQGRN
jgi:uncharacterized protein YfbU (UPF0304 family)